MTHMVEVGEKPPVYRQATAEGRLCLQASTIDCIAQGTVKKGNPLEVAKVAAIQAVKDTPRILPLCHPIPVTGVDVELRLDGQEVYCQLSVSATYRTGVEMEALTGVAAALLTVWDMTKYLEKDAQGQYPETSLGGIRVVKKIKRAPDSES